MAKDTDNLIELQGTVTERLRSDEFFVKLTEEGFEGTMIRAKISGRMRSNYIRIIPGDKVRIEMSPADLGRVSKGDLPRGRINYRFK